MALKPLPKAIAVGIFIGGLVYGLSFLKFPSKPATEKSEPTTVSEQVQSVEQQAFPTAQPVQAPPPIAQAPQVPFVEGGVGIASGQPTGTNFPMVANIAKVCSTADHPINNVVSDGSVDNIFKIYSDKRAQFGVIQEDALSYQQAIDPKMMSRVVAVFPFFSVEVHAVVAENSPIRSLADMQGKRVIEGPEGSGTWVTTQVIKAQTGIQWNAMHLSQKDGLAAVQNGTADVEFVVAGKPITMLKTAQGVRLVPISHPALDQYKYYTRTMIQSGSYPFQSTGVSTYKVNNVLATYAFKNQYQKEIGDLVTCITRNMDELQMHGHEKWKDVDPLDIDRVKWPVHPSAVAAIKRESRGRK